MTEQAIRERAAQVRSLEAEREQLYEQIREARAAGAKIRELEEWTGYSRRRIFQLLEDERKER